MQGYTGNHHFEPKVRRCAKHGILEESLEKTETISLGKFTFCEKCLIHFLAQYGIRPLELETLKKD